MFMESLLKYLTHTKRSNLFELSDDDKTRLLYLDKKYWDVVVKYKEKFNIKEISNLDEEYSKFIKAKKGNKKYFPVLKFDSLDISSSEDILSELKDILTKFRTFNCYISKYYIELINDMIHTIEFFKDVKHKHPWYTEYRKQTPSLKDLEGAHETLKKHPYVPTDDDRNIRGKEASEQIQKYIDKKGYKWQVVLNDKIIPRMTVSTDKIMNVNPNAKFSQVDIEGLKAHEVDAHIGRRFYGYKTGLYLFVVGLRWRNTLDEGLAVYNSLHKCNNVKPNVHFNIALKTIIAYYLDKKDFCELFDMCKNLVPNMPDKKLFKTIIRYKRELQDCSIIGGNGDDMSYFCGYQIVKDMTDKERDDVLKYNIGPDQLSELPNIKKFLRLNKFPSLI